MTICTNQVHVVDAHAFVWFLADDIRLGDAAKAVFVNPKSRFVLPAIVLAEAYWTIRSGRTPLTADVLQSKLAKDKRFTVEPLTQAIVEKSNTLSAINEMHDRQIVATALYLMEQGETVSLLTADQNITASGLVPIVW